MGETTTAHVNFCMRPRKSEYIGHLMLDVLIFGTRHVASRTFGPCSSRRRFTQLWSDSLLKVCRRGGGSTVELKHPKMLCPNTSTCNPGHIFKINRSWRPRRLSSCNMHSQRISRQPHAHDLGRDLRERTCKRCRAPTIKQESMERGKHTNICKKMKKQINR